MKQYCIVGRVGLLFTGLVLLISACGRTDLSALHPQGPIADKQLGLMQLSIIIMTIVVMTVFSIAIYVVFRYRRRPGENEIPQQVEGNHKLEIIWTVIPLILIIILAIPTVKYVFSFAKDYSQDGNAIKVQVTGHQFWWEFYYPEFGIRTAQDLIIPTGKKVVLELKTTDVLHSFWLPAIAGKMDTNPVKNENKMYIETYRDGVYRGKCAELCGVSHAFMEFKVKSVNEMTFQAWVTEMKAEPKPFIADRQGAESFKQNCMSCHAIDNNPSVGPNLKGIGSRETIAGMMLNRDNAEETIEPQTVIENITKWILYPHKLKPGNAMPAFEHQLSKQEVEGIAKYLAAYKLDSLKKINKQAIK